MAGETETVSGWMQFHAVHLAVAGTGAPRALVALQAIKPVQSTHKPLYTKLTQEVEMAEIFLQGKPVQTIGKLPAVGMQAPAFKLVKTDLSEAGLQDFTGKNIILNIFLSLDTSVCAASVRRFNMEASESPDTVVLCISADLPFAHKRFCETEGLSDVIPLSVFRSPDFGRDYGVTFTSGPLSGLLSRAVVIIDKSGQVAYAEQVDETTREPDYDAALLALSQLTG
jgi:thiol peroxidase